MSNFDGAVPALTFISLEGAEPSLKATRCAACDAVVTGASTACPSCGARDGLQPVELGRSGMLHSFTIVHRSFPGVAVPFIAGVVDIDGGGALKGTFIDLPPDPDALLIGLRVDIVFRDTGQRNADGKPFVSYFFQPQEAIAL